MDWRQFNGIADVGRDLPGTCPCSHRFVCAVAKAPSQRAAIRDLEMKPFYGPVGHVIQSIRDGNRIAEVCDRLGISRSLQRLLTGLAPPLQGNSGQPRFSEMVGYD